MTKHMTATSKSVYFGAECFNLDVDYEKTSLLKLAKLYKKSRHSNI